MFVITIGVTVLTTGRRYMFWLDTGEWRHRSVGSRSRNRKWLGSIKYAGGKMQFGSSSCAAPLPDDAFAEAEKVVEDAVR